VDQDNQMPILLFQLEEVEEPLIFLKLNELLHRVCIDLKDQVILFYCKYSECNENNTQYE
jgi:hypothetical protein